jgi:hypothetical protein
VALQRRSADRDSRYHASDGPRLESAGRWQGRSLGRDLGHAYETSLAILFLSRATFPPRKGAVTPAGRPASITPTKGAATLAKAKSHRHAFEIYLSLEPDTRREEQDTMDARGPGLIDHLLGVLERDGRTRARGAAHVLLERLLDKRFLYTPGAPAQERKVMAAAIRAS